MILIATACPELRARCNQAVQPYGAVLSTASFTALEHLIVRLHLGTIFVDLALPGFTGPDCLRELHRLNPLTKLVVMGGSVSEDMELRMFLAGASGFIRENMDCRQIGNVFLAVESGELWIRRSLIPHLLDGMRATTQPESQPRMPATRGLPALTPREHEISLLVGHGKSNKQIANSLAITERTVKAHLSEIFRKLSINDRLTLALRVLEQRDSTGPLEASGRADILQMPKPSGINAEGGAALQNLFN